jgi:hypothetical protein
LRDDLSLTYLEIDDFLDGEGRTSTGLPALSDVVCEGQQEVAEGLESLIEEVKREYPDELSQISGEESSLGGMLSENEDD